MNGEDAVGVRSAFLHMGQITGFVPHGAFGERFQRVGPGSAHMAAGEQRSSELSRMGVDVGGHARRKIDESHKCPLLGVSVGYGHLDASFDLLPLHLVRWGNGRSDRLGRCLRRCHVDGAIERDHDVAEVRCGAAVPVGLATGLLPEGTRGQGGAAVGGVTVAEAITQRHANVAGLVAVQWRIVSGGKADDGVEGTGGVPGWSSLLTRWR